MSRRESDLRATAALAGSAAEPTLYFYLMPSRLWQLAAGALLADAHVAHPTPTLSLVRRLVPSKALPLAASDALLSSGAGSGRR